MEKTPILTVITPTTGKKSLFRLVETITNQDITIPICHIILWDNKREEQFVDFMSPFSGSFAKDYWEEYKYVINPIILKDSFINGEATGSALRSIGLMAANSQYVTFADDDILWEHNHVSSMISSINNKLWAYCKRKIWSKDQVSEEYEYLGIDEFESMGEEAKTQYKMVDNNSLIFDRRLGTSAAVLYRETKEYNDDRLMYTFLKLHAGEPGITGIPTINQVCPVKLYDFFKKNCTLSQPAGI